MSLTRNLTKYLTRQLTQALVFVSSVIDSVWLLATGSWNDSGVWDDTAVWPDENEKIWSAAPNADWSYIASANGQANVIQQTATPADAEVFTGSELTVGKQYTVNVLYYLELFGNETITILNGATTVLTFSGLNTTGDWLTVQDTFTAVATTLTLRVAGTSGNVLFSDVHCDGGIS